MVDPRADSVRAIGAWLQRELQAGNVSARADQHGDAIVFLIEFPDGNPVREFEVSEEALDDHPPEEILADLERERVPERLLRDPTMRLAYSTDRDVPHLESIVVRVDGKQYRLVRDSSHAVHAYDVMGKPLANLPSPLPVLQVSIHRRPEHNLAEDIRGWRGPGQ